ncbi:hypothetical protein [Nitrospira sp. Nam74]
MAAMLIMKVATDNVVDMIAMRHGMVPTLGMMSMLPFVLLAGVARCARDGITRADVNRMLVDMVAMQMVHVTIVQIVVMIAMHDGVVSALRAVRMLMSLMDRMLLHNPPPIGGHSNSLLK